MPSSASSSRLTAFFFFNDTATTEIYTLSLPDALPISLQAPAAASKIAAVAVVVAVWLEKGMCRDRCCLLRLPCRAHARGRHRCARGWLAGDGAQADEASQVLALAQTQR